jgi:hypothetical protein
MKQNAGGCNGEKMQDTYINKQQMRVDNTREAKKQCAVCELVQTCLATRERARTEVIVVAHIRAERVSPRVQLASHGRNPPSPRRDRPRFFSFGSSRPKLSLLSPFPRSQNVAEQKRVILAASAQRRRGMRHV